MTAHNILKDSRFAGIEPFESKVWLASPTMHGEEQYWVDDAIKKNWVSTVGENINEIEKQVAHYVGCSYAVALSAGTASLHLATKLAGEKLYGQAFHANQISDQLQTQFHLYVDIRIDTILYLHQCKIL